MKRIGGSFFVIALLILMTLSHQSETHADTIVLKDGDKYYGKVLTKPGKKVVLQMKIGIIKFYPEEVANIIRESYDLTYRSQTDRGSRRNVQRESFIGSKNHFQAIPKKQRFTNRPILLKKRIFGEK